MALRVLSSSPTAAVASPAISIAAKEVIFRIGAAAR
jgi:hypothetical protein